MKSIYYLLLCLFVTTQANAVNSESLTHPASLSLGMNSAGVSAADFSVQNAPGASKLRPTHKTQAKFPEIRSGVADEVRSSAAFVRNHVTKEESSDGWLIALAALGLIFLQLRRKHNSLPQRRIAPYA